MRPDFETALLDLIAKYAEDTPVDEMISALELRLFAMHDEWDWPNDEPEPVAPKPADEIEF